MAIATPTKPAPATRVISAGPNSQTNKPGQSRARRDAVSSVRSVSVVAVVADVTGLVGVVVDHGPGFHNPPLHDRRAILIDDTRRAVHHGWPVIDRRRTQRVGHQPDHGAGDNGAGNPATTAPVTTVAVVAAVITVITAMVAVTTPAARRGAQRHRHSRRDRQADRGELARTTPTLSAHDCSPLNGADDRPIRLNVH